MPRYHFNVYDGVTDLDREGTVLSDPNKARSVALQRAGMILRDEAAIHALGEDWCLEVTDESGIPLFKLNFDVSLSPVRWDKKH